MTTLNLISNNVIIYICLVLLLLYILYTYKQEFNPKDLINYLLYLTNKILLFMLLITFLLVTIFSLINHETNLINNFIKETLRGLIYYVIINYAVYYGIKLIFFVKDFFKENDLFGISYIDKDKLLRGKEK